MNRLRGALRGALCLALLALPLGGCFEDAETEPDGVDAAMDGGLPPGRICRPDETTCDAQGRLRTCLETGDGWLVERCEGEAMCVDGACVERVCAPYTARCADETTVETCAADGAAFVEPTPCAEGETCADGRCLPPVCAPGERLCGEAVLLTCAADGRGWERAPCAEGEQCVSGACAAPPGPGPSCEPGEVLCGRAAVYTCAEDGVGFTEVPCPAGQVCFEGACIACVRDSDCRARDRACVAGQCVPPPLRVVTDALPPGQVDGPYETALEAVFGTPPYRWLLVEGALPRGVGLNGEGIVRGVPQEAGQFPVVFRVTDDARATATAELTLTVLDSGLVVATEALPAAEEGLPYDAQLEALGGEAPYGWLITDGALPAGLALGADGRITGTPSEIGPFPLTVRVVDAGEPPQAAERELVLEVEVAPLEIVADQVLDLFFTRVITLPTLTVIGGNPLPYDTTLTARGGLRPHTWAETDLPANLRQFVPQAGIPEGLVLAPDGRLSGVVASFDQQIEVEIPFTGIVLTGFFFTAEVTDSQAPPDSDDAIFLLPTLPL